MKTHLNLANKITLLRIILVPVFLFFLLTKINYGAYIAVAIFVIAISTDGLDGYIARTKNQITKLGKLMDPLADKLLISSALIALVEMGKLPAWIAIIIIGREFAIMGLRVLAASEGIIISASKLGKIKTVTQTISIITLLMNNYPFSLVNFPFGTISTIVAVFFTILSGIDYFYKNIDIVYS